MAASNTYLKFLCSYSGKIVPRPSDGRLRYVGGITRLVSVPASISFSDLIVKFGQLCGFSVKLRCQLPAEDLDVLISVKSDEDLCNVYEEYRLASLMSGKDLKIRAILSPLSLSSPSPSPPCSSSSSSSTSGGTRKINCSKPPIYPAKAPINRSKQTPMRRIPSQKLVQYSNKVNAILACYQASNYQYHPCHLQPDSRQYSPVGHPQ